MGLLARNADPKRVVGAYLCVDETYLYRVVEVKDDGRVTGENVKNGYVSDFTALEVKNARLVTPLPEPLDDELASLDAAYDAAPLLPDPPPAAADGRGAFAAAEGLAQRRDLPDADELGLNFTD